MKAKISTVKQELEARSLWWYCWSKSVGQPFVQSLLVLLGIVLVLSGTAEPANAYSGAKYKEVCNNLVSLAESSFGAMLTAIAGIGAIIASAMGGFKMAWGCIVVSVGSFIVGSYIELFFGKCGG